LLQKNVDLLTELALGEDKEPTDAAN